MKKTKYFHSLKFKPLYNNQATKAVYSSSDHGTKPLFVICLGLATVNSSTNINHEHYYQVTQIVN